MQATIIKLRGSFLRDVKVGEDFGEEKKRCGEVGGYEGTLGANVVKVHCTPI